MVFIENKYTKWYNNIVSNAQARAATTGYTEKHHIIPKSLGGANDKNNLVVLTAREHFICHWLLTKMVLNKTLKQKMQFALNSFRRTSSNQSRHVLLSRHYEIIRKQVSIARSEAQKGNKFALGHKHSPEAIAKRVRALTGQKKRPRTIEEKLHLSLVLTGLKRSEETKQKMRKPKSASHRLNLQKPRGPRGPVLALQVPKKKVTCPHCGKIGGAGNMKRYHFENCGSSFRERST